MPKKIVLKGTGAEQYDGRLADATITPGDLVKRTSTGVIRHSTAAGNAMPMFAVNSADQNRGIDSDYAAGEDVPVVIAQRGCQIYALVAASAAAIVVGDYLESNGAGGLRKYTAQATNEGGAGTYTIQVNGPIAIALEAVDNSGGGSKVRIRAEIL